MTDSHQIQAIEVNGTTWWRKEDVLELLEKYEHLVEENEAAQRVKAVRESVREQKS